MKLSKTTLFKPKQFNNLTIKQFKPGVTLIEAMIVVVILAIMATASLVFLSSGTRKAQTRDAQRKKDITDITEAIGFYLTATETLPGEGKCDSSIGSSGILASDYECFEAGFTSSGDWNGSSDFYTKIITAQQILKNMPKDPKNNLKFHYRYEPSGTVSGQVCLTEAAGFFVKCATYWIGAKLEAPTDPSKWIFRCSDIPNLTQGIGCKEINPRSDCTPTTREDCWQEHP